MRLNPRIMLASFAISLAFWIVHILFDYLIYFPGQGSSFVVAFSQAPAHEIFIGIIFLTGCLAAGALVSGYVNRERQIREYYSSLFEQAAVPVFMVDQNGRFIDTNEAGEHLLGYPKSELVKLTINDVVNGDEKSEAQVDIDILRGGERAIATRKLQCKDGTVKYVDITSQQLKDGRFMAICKDVTADRESRKRINENRKKYQDLFENLIDGFALHEIVLDEDGKPVDYIFIEVNYAFEQLTGLKKEKIIGKKVTEAIPGIENDPADWIGTYGKVALTGEAAHFEQFAEPLGDWYHVTAYSPAPDLFATIFEKITERKQTEEAFREHQKVIKSERDRAQLYLDVAGVIILGIDTDGNINILNEKGCSLLGYEKPSDAIGVNWFKTHLPEPMRETYMKKFGHFLTANPGEIEWTDENPVLTLDGREKIISWKNISVLDSDGNPAGTLSSGEDITERKATENRLRWELNLQTVLSGIARSIVSEDLDIDDIAEIVCHYSQQLTGSPHGFVSTIDPQTGDLISQSLGEIMDAECLCKGDDRRFVVPANEDGTYPHLWGHALNTKRGFFTNTPEEHESNGGLPEGHVPIDNYLAVPVILGEEVVGQIALANSESGYTDRDLEGMNRVAELFSLAIQGMRYKSELSEKNIELAKALKTQTEFLSMVSHELRTPLVPIIGYTDLLLDGSFGELPHDSISPLEAVRNRAQDLTKLIEDLLVVSRIDRGALKLDLQPICISQHINDTVQDFKSMHLGKNVSFNWHGPDFMILGDNNRLRQILRNLIDNAIKYSSDAVNIEIATTISGNTGQITVQDDGLGIDNDHIDRIFDRFYQVEELDTREHGGSGLGLAIVRDLVEMMNGTITVLSNPGIGTTFTLKFPILED